MSDVITDTLQFLLNGKIAGMPTIFFIAFIFLIFFVFYMIATRKPKLKEFKALDLKKEIRKDTKKEFSYFGERYNKYIYDKGEIETSLKSGKKPKPFGYVLGIMKVVWNDQYKRLVPLYRNENSAKQLDKMETASKEIYNKSFNDLDEKQKKDIRELAREELKDEWVEIQQVGKKIKIVRGKKEETFNVPIATFCLKLSKPNIVNRTFAKYLGLGISFFRFDSNQISIDINKIVLNANFQRKIFNDQFIFSDAGKKIIDDIAFCKDREQQLQAIANETSKVQFFDSSMGQHVEKLREQYKLEAEKHKAQTESHEMG